MGDRRGAKLARQDDGRLNEALSSPKNEAREPTSATAETRGGDLSLVREAGLISTQSEVRHLRAWLWWRPCPTMMRAVALALPSPLACSLPFLGRRDLGATSARSRRDLGREASRVGDGRGGGAPSEIAPRSAVVGRILAEICPSHQMTAWDADGRSMEGWWEVMGDGGEIACLARRARREAMQVERAVLPQQPAEGLRLERARQMHAPREVMGNGGRWRRDRMPETRGHCGRADRPRLCRRSG